MERRGEGRRAEEKRGEQRRKPLSFFANVLDVCLVFLFPLILSFPKVFLFPEGPPGSLSFFPNHPIPLLSCSPFFPSLTTFASFLSLSSFQSLLISHSKLHHNIELVPGPQISSLSLHSYLAGAIKRVFAPTLPFHSSPAQKDQVLLN